MDRVLLFTEEPVLANGLAHVLKSFPEIELEILNVSAASLAEAVQNRDRRVLIFDFQPDHFGYLHELRTRIPDCKVVLWLRAISHELAFQTMRLGVRGILRKTVPPHLLVKCVKTVAAGEMWFDQDLTASFLEAKTVALTARESQLVELVSQGLKNKQVATELGIAEATVRIYLSTLFRKLDLQDRYELAIYGMKNMVPTRPSSQGEDRDETSRREAGREQVCPRVLVMGRRGADAASHSDGNRPSARPKVRSAVS